MRKNIPNFVDIDVMKMKSDDRPPTNLKNMPKDF
jgi:hypothetical protein